MIFAGCARSEGNAWNDHSVNAHPNSDSDDEIRYVIATEFVVAIVADIVCVCGCGRVWEGVGV